VLPMDYTNWIPADPACRAQGLGMNQELRVFGQPLCFWLRGVVSWSSAATAEFGVETNWNFTVRGGDSSNPVRILIGNQLVLVSHNSSYMSGPDYSFYLPPINRAMHCLSTNNNLQTDYQLTTISLTNWPVVR
jgi:hypothetical protein